MPSLRRTLSSPSVRSSPYSNGSLAARGGGHRRSSGSETTNRRVLADIEWWKVTDGQCYADADQEQEDRNRGDQDIISLEVLLGTQVDNGVDHPLPTSLPWIPSFTTEVHHLTFCSSVSPDFRSYQLNLPPTEQFSGLSITPHTPTHRHHSLESSSSSLESTPEAAGSPLESLGLRLLDIDMGFPETPFPTFHLGKTSHTGTLTPVIPRAFSFADCLSMEDGQVNEYADFALSPLSSSPDFLNWGVEEVIITSKIIWRGPPIITISPAQPFHLIAALHQHHNVICLQASHQYTFSLHSHWAP